MNRARRNSLRRKKENQEARRERSSVTNTEATLNKKRSLTASWEGISDSDKSISVEWGGSR